MESAVTLTKAVRWDIQSLGFRLEKAASAEESSRRNKTKVESKLEHEKEIRQIVLDIRKLLHRIDDAIPLINLAITTSGANLTTRLPASVSPSRLLQASTFLTAGDAQYSMYPNVPVQVGPTFTLSLYMLFAGHNRAHDDGESVRETTWKEVIHKARVKLVRVPLRSIYGRSDDHNSQTGEASSSTSPIFESIEGSGEPMRSEEGKASEYAYHIELIEDLNDDRVHSFEDGEPQPGPYKDVKLAGIRELVPIHQISKIFYADTGKILNIGSPGETNSPVLLLKRDTNAVPPRRMMQDNETNYEWNEVPEGIPTPEEAVSDEDNGSQDDIDQQIRRESSVHLPNDMNGKTPPKPKSIWRLPPDLDPEWLALEVYTEEEDESGTEDGEEINDDSAYVSHRPSSSGINQSDESLAADLAGLNIESRSSPPVSTSTRQFADSVSLHASAVPSPSHFGLIRTSLSLLEMLIRLTALQQFQQASHLAISDELLTFFLEESSTTGAGGNNDERRRTRREARQKVGFDPYDESPVKRHGEDYQYQNQDPYQENSRASTPYQEGSRGGTPNSDYYQGKFSAESPGWMQGRGITQRTPEAWRFESREKSSGSVRSVPNALLSSPISPYKGLPRKAVRPVERVKQGLSKASPLGRGMSAETDSTLGTSPGSPTLLDRKDRLNDT